MRRESSDHTAQWDRAHFLDNVPGNAGDGSARSAGHGGLLLRNFVDRLSELNVVCPVLACPLGLRYTRASLKSLILGQTVFPEIGEATQFACHATFGLGYLAYCGALETRAHSLLIVRSSSRWGALGLWAGISNAHPNDYTLLGFTSFSQTYRAAPRPCPSAGACHEIKYNV